MEDYKNEALEYLQRLERFCEWLETVRYKSSYDGFVKAGIITRGELRDKKFLSLRRNIVFWSNHGWTRSADWKAVLESKRQDLNEWQYTVEENGEKL